MVAVKISAETFSVNVLAVYTLPYITMEEFFSFANAIDKVYRVLQTQVSRLI